MKIAAHLPFVISLLIAAPNQIKGQGHTYDAVPDENRELLFEDMFDGKGNFANGDAKVKDGKLILKKNTKILKDLGLHNDDDYEIEVFFDPNKASGNQTTGIIFSANNLKNLKIAAFNQQKLRLSTCRNGKWSNRDFQIEHKSGYNKLTVRVLDKVAYIFYNEVLAAVAPTTSYGHKVGLDGPEKGESKFHYLRVYKIRKYPSSLERNAEVYQFATLSKEKLDTDIMQPETLVAYSVSFKNNGPFRVDNLNIELKESGGNTGIEPELFTKKLEDGRVGKEVGAGWFFRSSDKLKSGVAKYEIILRDEGEGFEYGPYPVEFKTEGFPPPDLIVQNLTYIENGNSQIRGGSVGTLTLELANEGVGEALGLKVTFDKSNTIRAITDNVSEVIPPGGSRRIKIKVVAPLTFDGDSETIKIKLEAKGMDAKEYDKSFPVTSFNPINSNTIISPALKGYYGNLPGFDYGKLKSALEADVDKNGSKAILWKSIFLNLGDGGFDYDPIKAKELARSSVASVYNMAFDGDMEAQLLMGLAYQYGLGVPQNNSIARDLLGMASERGYEFANYALGLNTYVYYAGKSLSDAKKELEAASAKGIKKADYWLGVMHLEGKGFTKNEKEAYRIFKRTADIGDPKSMFMVGSMHLSGTGTEIDTEKAHTYLKSAAELGVAEAMILLGTFYTTGTYGQAKNEPEAHKWLSKAANRGSINAMFTYGVYQLSDEHLGENFAAAHKYLLQAAKLEHGGAMKMLGRIYQDGLGTNKNTVKARFWVNEAELYGEQISKTDPRFENYAMNILNNMDWNSALFGNTLYGTDQYGREVEVNTGSDMMGQVLGGVFSSWMSSRVPDPNATNSYEFIMKKGSSRIYAATINSYKSTEIEVKRGEKIDFIVSGSVQVGMFAGVTSPRGIGGYRSYNVAGEHPHGSFIARVGDGDWQYISAMGSIEADREGKLQIALNDRDNSNNRGGFDVRIEIN